MTGQRVLAALRLSRDQSESTSIDGQREQVTAWAAAHGHAVVAESVDTDVSGSIPARQRPDLARRLADLDSFDIVAGIKIDRLSRDTADFLAFAKWLNSHGKTLVSTAESIVLDGSGSASDTFTATMLAGVATMERNRMSERARDSRARLSAAGRWGGGKAPFGYVTKCLCHDALTCPLAPKSAGWRLAQDPATAPYARQMAERCIDGHSNGVIAAWLNTEGIPTQRGRAWRPETVGTVLRGHSLAGYASRKVNGNHSARRRSSDGSDITVTDDPILADDLWRKVQAALDSRKQDRAPRRIGAHQLLHVAYCRECSDLGLLGVREDDGGIREVRESDDLSKIRLSEIRPRKLVPLYGHRGLGRSRTGTAYRCERCGYGQTKARLESAVESMILASIGSKYLPKRVDIPGESHTEELHEVERKITEIDQAFTSGDLPITAYSRMMATLEGKRDELARLPQREARTVYEPTGQTVAEHWSGLDADARGVFLRKWRFSVLAGRDGLVFWFPAIFADAAMPDAPERLQAAMPRAA